MALAGNGSRQSLLARLLLEIKAAEKALELRVDEALAAEQRLVRRLDRIEEAEKNLKVMLDAVRREVEEARPLLKPLPQIRQTARDSLDKAMAAVEGGVEKVLTQSLSQARKRIDSHTQSLVKDLDAAAQAFGNELATELERAQKESDALAGKLHRRLENAREQYVEMEGAVEARMKEVATQMYANLVVPPRLETQTLQTVPTPSFPQHDLSKLEKAGQLLSESRVKVNTSLKPISSPRPLGRAPEYLRFGPRVWRGKIVNDCTIQISVRAA